MNLGGANIQVIGFLRAASHVFPLRNSQISGIAPWLTQTTFTSPVLLEQWTKEGLPLNKAEDVAKAIVMASQDKMNGKCLFVAGGKFIEIEEGIDSNVHEWLGEKVGDAWKRGIALLNSMEPLDMEVAVDAQGSSL